MEPFLFHQDRNRTHLPLPKLDALTSMRFFAAAMIVFQHADLHFWHLRALYWMNLKQGVTFFFVLSGFILFYNYPKPEGSKAIAKFLVARFARIWPAAAVAAVLVLTTLNATLTFPARGNHLFWISFCEFAMIKAWIPSVKYYIGLNPPSWSIAAECFFYLLFPLLVVNFRRTWQKKFLICSTFSGAIVASAYFVFPARPRESDHLFEHWLLYFNPAIRVFEFTLGMCAALVFMRLREINSLSKELITCFQLISLAAVCLSLRLSLMPLSELIKPLSSPIQFWIDGSGACFAFAFFICCMAFSKGLLAKALANPVLIFLGEASYSLYLLHWTFERWLAIQLDMGRIVVMDNVAGWEVGLVFSIILLSASALVYTFVENPCGKLITSRYSAWAARHEMLVFQDYANALTHKKDQDLVAETR